jgi:hypothetical protein
MVNEMVIGTGEQLRHFPNKLLLARIQFLFSAKHVGPAVGELSPLFLLGTWLMRVAFESILSTDPTAPLRHCAPDRGGSGLMQLPPCRSRS